MTTRSSERPAPPAQADLDMHPVLQGLDPEHAGPVLEHARVFTAATGETLFHAGDPARRFFVVRRGQLKLFRVGDRGNEKIVGLVNAGDSFAEAAAFMQARVYPVDCEAVQPSEVVGFDTAHFVDLLRAEPESCIRLLGILSRRLQQRVADIESLSLQNAQLRIVNYIRQLHDQAGERARLPSSKKSIAGLLAVQPETLSRVLTLLQQQQVVAVDGRELRLLDREALEAIGTGQRPL